MRALSNVLSTFRADDKHALLQGIYGVSTFLQALILLLSPHSLSAHLYEQTSESPNSMKYMSAALLSAEFLRNHLYRSSSIVGIIALIGDCPAVPLEAIQSSFQGFTIDGLSSLSTVNNSYTQL